METAPKEKLGLCPIGILEFEPLRDLFQLESSQILLHSFVGGKIDPNWMKQWLQPQKTKSIPEELRQYLSQKLPEYMIPSVYILIDNLPLSANGKIDRKLLPKSDNLRLSIQSEFTEPRTDLEKAISAIWQKSLSLDKVGIYDNFFELGGNSFLATQVLGQLRQSFQIDFKIRQFFEMPRIADLALFIENNSFKKDIEIIEKVNRVSIDDINQLSEEDVDVLLERLLKEEV
jgi:acyl carrier protein